MKSGRLRIPNGRQVHRERELWLKSTKFEAVVFRSRRSQYLYESTGTYAQTDRDNRKTARKEPHSYFKRRRYMRKYRPCGRETILRNPFCWYTNDNDSSRKKSLLRGPVWQPCTMSRGFQLPTVCDSAPKKGVAVSSEAERRSTQTDRSARLRGPFPIFISSTPFGSNRSDSAFREI